MIVGDAISSQSSMSKAPVGQINMPKTALYAGIQKNGWSDGQVDAVHGTIIHAESTLGISAFFLMEFQHISESAINFIVDFFFWVLVAVLAALEE